VVPTRDETMERTCAEAGRPDRRAAGYGGPRLEETAQHAEGGVQRRIFFCSSVRSVAMAVEFRMLMMRRSAIAIRSARVR
jgi:hypothetical protein